MATSPFSNPFESKTSTVNPQGGNKDTTKPASGKTADEIEDLLNMDDDKVDDDKKPEIKDDDLEDEDKDNKSKPSDKDDEDKKEDDDEEEDKDDIKLKEEDDEDDEEKKEKLDLDKDDDDETKLTAPPKVAEITAKYPKFFEDFPFLKRMMFRDKAYTEMFGSFDEAKEVFNKVDRLNEFETQLLNGDLRDVLSTVKTADPKAFDKLVDGWLSQLGEVDKEAYDDVIQNFGKRIIHGMVDEAKRKNNKELHDSAKALYEYLFDADPEKADLNIKVRSKVEKNEEKEAIDKERQALINERFESARDSLTVKVDNILKSTISDYIDPRGVMTNYEKKNAIEETLKRLHAKVGEDSSFRKNLDRLWKAAFGDKFSENSLNGIKKSYLGKAKGLISSVIKEVRSEVLKDNRSKGRDKDKQDDDKETTSSSRESRKPVNAGRPHQQNNKANERKQGESVEEFFGRD